MQHVVPKQYSVQPIKLLGTYAKGTRQTLLAWTAEEGEDDAKSKGNESSKQQEVTGKRCKFCQIIHRGNKEETQIKACSTDKDPAAHAILTPDPFNSYKLFDTFPATEKCNDVGHKLTCYTGTGRSWLQWRRQKPQSRQN